MIGQVLSECEGQQSVKYRLRESFHSFELAWCRFLDPQEQVLVRILKISAAQNHRSNISFSDLNVIIEFPGSFEEFQRLCDGFRHDVVRGFVLGRGMAGSQAKVRGE